MRRSTNVARGACSRKPFGEPGQRAALTASRFTQQLTQQAKRNDLKALRNLISEAQTLLMTTNLPEGRSQRANELLTAAVDLADDLLGAIPSGHAGSKGREATLAKRGPDYFRQIAAKRKNFKGGRPPKSSDPN